jgi:hypothetical protein
MDSSRCRCGIIAASADAHERNQEETEMDATTVAVGVAKSVFEVAIANAEWRISARHRLNRPQFTRFMVETPAKHVVMEAWRAKTSRGMSRAVRTRWSSKPAWARFVTTLHGALTTESLDDRTAVVHSDVSEWSAAVR